MKRPLTINRSYSTVFVLLAATVLLASCGGGDSNPPPEPLNFKMAVLGDGTSTEIAENMRSRGLTVDNYIIFMDSEYPVISDNVVVWTDRRNGDADIYAYKISSGTEFRVNQDTGQAAQEYPQVNGDIIVWEDYRNGTARDIYAYRISTGTEFRVDQDSSGFDQQTPVVYGDYVVWTDMRNGGNTGDIYARNISTMAAEFRVNQDAAGTSYQSDPAIYGDYIVWVDQRSGYAEIYAYQISAGTETQVSQGPGAWSKASPVIHGDYIVWLDGRNFDPPSTNYYSDIYAYEISTQTEFKVNQVAANTYLGAPDVHGNTIVWSDWRSGPGTGTDIYAFTVTNAPQGTELRLTTDISNQRGPVIFGDTIAWLDERHGGKDIYAYSISTGTETRVNANSTVSEYGHPVIYGDFIAWHDNRNGLYDDIYAYSVSTGVETLASNGKQDIFGLASRVTDYEVILFGDRLDWPGFGQGGGLALGVFDAADAAGVSAMAIGMSGGANGWSLGYIFELEQRFGLATSLASGQSDMEVDVTTEGLGHAIFKGITTSATLIFEDSPPGVYPEPVNEEQSYAVTGLHAPADWTVLAEFGPAMGLSGQCAIAEFTTANGTSVILDGSANTADRYNYWTQTRWDLLYNELVYLAGY